MQQFRAYRLVPALLALSLVLTAATPLVRYSCGMSAIEMATMPCCDGKAGHHDAPAMPMHGEMPAHDGMAGGEMPCHDAPGDDAPALPSPCPDTDGPALHDACCTTADTPAAPPPERVDLNPTALVVLVASFLLPADPPAHVPAPPSSESPPAPPVALHLLYGTFLT